MSPPDAPEAAPGWLWTGRPALVAVALAVAFANVPPLLPILTPELGLSNLEAGLLPAAGLLTHTLLQLPAGPLVDRFGARRVALAGLITIALGTLGSGLAPTYAILLLARLAMGVGSGLGFLAGLVLAGELAPRGRVAMAQSIYGAAFQTGILIALVATPALAAAGASPSATATSPGGWRAAFLLEGAAMVGVVALLARLLPSRRSERRPAPLPWAAVARHPGVYALGLAHVATYGVYTAVMTWAPTYLVAAFAAAPALAGALSAFIAPGGIAGRLIGGRLGFEPRREPAIILGAGLVSVALALVWSSGIPLSPTLAALALLGVVSGMSFGVLFARAARLFGPGAAGLGTGAVNFVANVGALAFAPLVGALIDLTGSFAWGFRVLAVLAILGLVNTALYLRREATSP